MFVTNAAVVAPVISSMVYDLVFRLDVFDCFAPVMAESDRVPPINYLKKFVVYIEKASPYSLVNYAYSVDRHSSYI